MLIFEGFDHGFIDDTFVMPVLRIHVFDLDGFLVRVQGRMKLSLCQEYVCQIKCEGRIFKRHITIHINLLSYLKLIDSVPVLSAVIVTETQVVYIYGGQRFQFDRLLEMSDSLSEFPHLYTCQSQIIVRTGTVRLKLDGLA